MNNNFRNTIIAICVLYALTMGYTIKESVFNTTTVNDITSVSASFFTLIIAILLYDKFDYRRIIFEKKLQVVLNLLEQLKKTSIFIGYSNTVNDTHICAAMTLNQRDINHYKQAINPDSFVVFFLKDAAPYFREIDFLMLNPYMPKEIVAKLEALSINQLEGVATNIDYINEHTKIGINSTPKNVTSLEGYMKPNKNVTFKDFLNSYLECFNSIEIWIDKHSNIKSDLNI